MEPQKIQNCQSDPEKEQSGRHQTILQSYRNQHSMVLAYIYSMQQNQKLRNNLK